MSTLRRSVSTSSISSLQKPVDFPSLPIRKEIKRESSPPIPLALSAPIKSEVVPNKYVSLPSSPIGVTPPGTRQRYASDVSVSAADPFSIWDYLREELLATDFDSHQEMKWERVSNFLSIPVAIEKVRQLCRDVLVLL
jgi:hypothetical protein